MTICHGPEAPQPVRARMSQPRLTAMANYGNQAVARRAKLACPLLENRELMRTPRALALLTPVLAVALTSVPLAISSPAHAQGGITITRFSVEQGTTVILDSSELGSSSLRGYNAAECAAASTIVTNFTLMNVPSGTTILDAWLSNGTTDCSLATARQTGNGRQCRHLLVNPDYDPTGTAQMTLAEMFEPASASEPVDNGCESSSQTAIEYTLWFFATGSTENTGEVQSSQYGSVKFRVDVGAPSAPTPSATTLSGGGSVSVSWTATSTNTANETYRVFVDDSISACGDTGQLAAGDVAPTDADYEVSALSARVNLSSYADDRSVLVFVSAVDASENQSVLSSPVCVTRIPTVGFCESLEAGGQPCTNSCVAGVGGSGPVHGAWWAAAAALAVAYRRRRARR